MTQRELFLLKQLSEYGLHVSNIEFGRTNIMFDINESQLNRLKQWVADEKHIDYVIEDRQLNEGMIGDFFKTIADKAGIVAKKIGNWLSFKDEKTNKIGCYPVASIVTAGKNIPAISKGYVSFYLSDSTKEMINDFGSKPMGKVFETPGESFLGVAKRDMRTDTKIVATVTYTPEEKRLIDKIYSELKNRPINESILVNHISNNYLKLKALKEGKLKGNLDSNKDLTGGAIIDITPQEMERKIIASLKYSYSQPMIIWGAPGIGKTQIISSILKNNKDFMDMDMITIAAPHISNEDILLPSVEEVTDKKHPLYGRKQTIMAPTGLLPFYAISDDEDENERRDKICNGPSGKGGVIFIDEFSRAEPQILNKFLTLFGEERKLSNFRLGSKWRLIFAANRPKDEPNERDTILSFTQSVALMNRFINFNLVPDIASWVSWARSQPNFIPEIIMFLEDPNFGESFYIKPDESEEFALSVTPRTWANINNALQIELAMANENRPANEKIENITQLDSRQVKLAVGGCAPQIVDSFMEFIKIFQTVSPTFVKELFENGVDSVIKLPQPNYPRMDTPTMRKLHETLGRYLVNNVGEDMQLKHLENWIEYLLYIQRTCADKVAAGKTIDSIGSAILLKFRNCIVKNFDPAKELMSLGPVMFSTSKDKNQWNVYVSDLISNFEKDVPGLIRKYEKELNKIRNGSEIS